MVWGSEISQKMMLWSEKSLSTLILGIILELASWMIKFRVLERLCGFVHPID